MARTSFVPFAALLTGRAKWRGSGGSWPAVLLGLLLWLAITWLHAPEASPIAVR